MLYKKYLCDEMEPMKKKKKNKEKKWSPWKHLPDPFNHSLFPIKLAIATDV